MFIYISSLSLSPFVLLTLTLVGILLPIYLIWTFHKISYGRLSPYFGILYNDLNIKEFNLLFPLFFLTILYGIFPDLIIRMIQLPLLSLLI
jgi:NADH:ubiquinone oxidoreductase subunit 4 (subunit M)